MKMWKCFLRFGAAAALLGCLGCVDFDYVGQSFPATPEDMPIAYYTERSDVPVGKYAIVGKATLTAPAEKMDSYELREYLVDQARAHGAEAVCLVEMKNIKVGLMPAGEGGGYNGPSNNQTNPDNVNAEGTPLATDSFGNQVTVQGETQYRWEVEVKALFFKDKAVVEKIMAERREKLEAYNASLPPLDEDPRVKDAPDKKNESTAVTETAGEGDTVPDQSEKSESATAPEEGKDTTVPAEESPDKEKAQSPAE